MATTEMVHVRIDKRVKQRAAKTLASMGLSVSDAVRVLLTRVAAEKALPFEVRLPNATTIAAMREARRGGLPSFDAERSIAGFRRLSGKGRSHGRRFNSRRDPCPGTSRLVD